VGCTLGALLGDVLQIPDKGVDFVMAALFITILTDQVRALFCRKGGAQ
jgi:predicted branched-subunit amino acid permease